MLGITLHRSLSHLLCCGGMWLVCSGDPQFPASEPRMTGKLWTFMWVQSIQTHTCRASALISKHLPALTLYTFEVIKHPSNAEGCSSGMTSLHHSHFLGLCEKRSSLHIQLRFLSSPTAAGQLLFTVLFICDSF